MSERARARRARHAANVDDRVPRSGVGHWFTRMASVVSNAMGSPWSFLAAVAVILLWALTGPVFNYSQDWQLVVNTGTTIITFLMVFLIQNTQNRDSRAIHLKLDELLRAVPKARNQFMEAEEEDLDEIERQKAIVDRADPNPPPHKAEQRANGNGKAKKP